jgi:lysophospholipase L1-like esterase
MLGRSSIGALAMLTLAAQAGCTAVGGTGGKRHWVATWASPQPVAEPRGAGEADSTDATVREVVRISLGGDRLRLRFSNLYGATPLRIDSATIALSADPSSARIDAASLRGVTFGGRSDVTIPKGAERVSDPVDFALSPLAHLAVSVHLARARIPQASRPGSRATSYLAQGDQTSEADFSAAPAIAPWRRLSGVDVLAPAGAAAIAVFADSDGYGAGSNTDKHWSDVLAERLQADPATRSLAVLNLGVDGVTSDGREPDWLSRFTRDVLAQPGLRAVIVAEGVSDLGVLARDGRATVEAHRALVASLTGAYQQMAARARARGVRVIGATIPPFGGSVLYHPEHATELDRQSANAWIRAPGAFDAVINFDALLQDPADPRRLRHDLDSGDGLHPSAAGYEAMGDAIPLSPFAAAVVDPKRALASTDGPALAITFDDLPVHGPLPSGQTRLSVARDIVGALREAGVPEVYGFVNGGDDAPRSRVWAVLDAWRAAGYPLGNHSWSHFDLNTVSAEDYVADIAHNEDLLARKMGAADWRWYRFPYLAEGRDAAKRAAVRQFLAQRGYRIAGVTMSFDDYLWNKPYARCLARRNTAGVAWLEQSYLDAARESVAYSRAASQALYRRDIPYVLLMHIGAFDAHMLPRLLELYRAEGFHFVGLAEASADPAYASDLDPSVAPGPVEIGDRLAAVGIDPSSPASYVARLDHLCQ